MKLSLKNILAIIGVIATITFIAFSTTKKAEARWETNAVYEVGVPENVEAYIMSENSFNGQAMMYKVCTKDESSVMSIQIPASEVPDEFNGDLQLKIDVMFDLDDMREWKTYPIEMGSTTKGLTHFYISDGDVYFQELLEDYTLLYITFWADGGTAEMAPYLFTSYDYYNANQQYLNKCISHMLSTD